MSEDTICAPATSPINSALAVIRISGPDSLRVANLIFSNSKSIKPRLNVYGHVVDKNTDKNQVIDDVILSYYKAPNSFTGEDSVEISCHGNPLIVQNIIKLLLKHNLRMAEPGEFSKRAFLNGKVDLTEAEAINQIINARSEWEVSAALKQMHGALKNLIRSIKQKIIEIKADVECGIDFSQEEIEFISYKEAISQINQIEKEVKDLYQRCKIGEKVSRGINMPLVGKPNVGKSSILNLLLNAERAIVTDIPGTTRDLIKETIQFAGVHVNLIDTAGIRDAGCEIEKIGIEMSKKEIENAPILLFIIDAKNGIDDEDMSILEKINNKNIIYLANKIDIASIDKINELEKTLNSQVIPFSANSGEGLTELEEKINSLIKAEFINFQDSFIADMRILNLLEASLEYISDIKNLLENSEPSEIVAFQLQSLIESLSEITGEISADDVLESVFSRFCIGK